MEFNDMREDPDYKQYMLLQEQLEFWRQQVSDDTLSPEEKKRAEEKCIEMLEKSTGALERFNRRWEEIDGPLPPMDEETLRYLRNKFADIGIEVTLDELKEELGEDGSQ